MNSVWWIVLAAGAAAALPKGQPHNIMKLPSFRGVAEVRSSLPGRMRLYIPAVSCQPELASQMKTQLEGTGAVHQVAIQPVTGSVLIRYDESQVQAPVVFGAALKLMNLDPQLHAHASGKLREGMHLLAQAVNQGILDATGGVLDAKTLAGGALTVAALRSKLQNGWAVPGAMTLLWWAARLFGVQGNE